MEALESGTNEAADAVGAIRARLMLRQRTLSDAKKEEVLGRLKSASQEAFRDLLSSSEEEEDEEDDVDDEDGGPCCVICYEGYEDQPENPLGIYVWSKVVPLSDEVLTDPKLIVSSVCSWNACHFACHEKAVRRNSTNRSEWEQAMLLNSRARCNSLMPILTSNSEISDSVFRNLLSTHSSSLRSCT